MAYVAQMDTLKISKRFEKVGLETKVAEELAEVISESQAQSRDDLATKNDILLLKNDLSSLEKNMKQEFKLIRSEIRNSMLMTVISLGGIIALIEKFVGH